MKINMTVGHLLCQPTRAAEQNQHIWALPYHSPGMNEHPIIEIQRRKWYESKAYDKIYNSRGSNGHFKPSRIRL